jgi:uncharacterized protein
MPLQPSSQTTVRLSDQEIRDALANSKTIAVIGLSPDPSRASNHVTEYMIHQGYEITGVRPGGHKPILGRPVVEKLSELTEAPDIIDVFRNSEAIPGIVDEIEKMIQRGLKPKMLWLQLGISHPQAEEKARSLGLKVVSNKCILIEHRKLI